MNLRRTACAAAVLAALVAGCSDARVVVRGKVTLDGKPVDGGSISFQPQDGAGPGTGGNIEDGEYRLEGPAAATPGSKIVTITVVMKTGKRIPAGAPHPPGTMIDEVVVFPPQGARNLPTQTAEAVVGKENVFDFELKSK